MDKDSPTIHHYCERGQLAEVRSMLAGDPMLIVTVDQFGIFPLHYAASVNSVPVAKLLVDTYVQLKNASSHGGSTGDDSLSAAPAVVVDIVNVRAGELASSPLHWACRHGHVQVATFLVQMGADAAVVDSQLLTPLHVAAQTGHAMLCCFLLAHLSSLRASAAAVVNARDSFGWTPFMWIVYKALYDTIGLMRLFLRYGADINAVSAVEGDGDGGETALDWAIKGKLAYPAVKFMLDRGACRGVRVSSAATIDGDDGCGGGGGVDELAMRYDASGVKGGVEYRLTSTACMRSRRNWTLAVSLLPAASMVFVAALMASHSWTVAVPVALCVVVVVHALIFNRLGRHDRMALQKSPYLSCLVQQSIVLVSGLWLFHVLPWRVRNNSSSTALVFEIVVCGGGALASLYFNFKTCYSDPGFVPTFTSVDEERALILRLARDGQLDDKHFCRSCLIRKPLRSKHCTITDRCVARFDHYCPWLMNAVGAGNQRHFVSFIIALIVGGLAFITVFVSYLRAVTADGTGSQPLPANSQCYLNRRLCRMFVSDTAVVMAVGWTSLQLFWAGIMLITQLGYISLGSTTNEQVNFYKYDYMSTRTGIGHGGAFNLGTIQNCYAFWLPSSGAWRDVDWRFVFEVPVPSPTSINRLPLVSRSNSNDFNV